ncbi:MAG: hypothetical protein E6I56_07605 [Chloroflexi bacterium]|nr:MAG: hypothetical protein E6I56_07605 [Chloroflexota bacterium]
MDVVEWLLNSDPAIRWQVMRDLNDAPEEEVAVERARVASEGWGARLLALQREDGQWDGGIPTFSSAGATNWWQSLPRERQGTLFPEWTSTAWSLMLLRAFGLEPASAGARRAVRLVREHCRWEHDGEPFFAGEVEPCINGRTVAIGAYFGEDVEPIVARLLGEQMGDGGWNCEQENGSTRGSFHTTIDVLEGLLEYERAVGSVLDVTAARLRGQAYLLERRMLRRLSTGEVIVRDRVTNHHAAWTEFSYPTYWHYDVLRGLDYLRAGGALPDKRVAEAIALVESKRGADGRWPLENPHPGRLHFAMDEGEGKPSRWNTLRAMRVLRSYQLAGDAAANVALNPRSMLRRRGPINTAKA